jgi:hypothetical protein
MCGMGCGNDLLTSVDVVAVTLSVETDEGINEYLLTLLEVVVDVAHVSSIALNIPLVKGLG